MDTILDPFVGDGYSLSTLTDAINVFPNRYGRINELGLFGDGEGITTKNVTIEIVNGVLNLLPSKPRGAPGSQGSQGKGKMLSLTVPHFPHDDVLMPDDIAFRRAPGSANAPLPWDQALARKLQTMASKHDITLEYWRMGAVKGILLDADASTYVNLYNFFNIAQNSVDFDLGNAGTDVAEKCRAVVRLVEDNLLGDVMTGIRVLVSQEFWDKLVKHASVKDAYKYFATTGAQPLREDMRKGFPFHNLVFEEYRGASVQLNQDGTQTARRFIAAGEGHAFPVGTQDTFAQYNAPADFNETVGTLGLPVYSKMEGRKMGRGWDIHTQSNRLPICRRPGVLVRVYSGS